MLILSLGMAVGAETSQAAFDSPKQALHALASAVKSNDTGKVLSVLGPDAKDIVSTGDPVADKQGRQRFVDAYNRHRSLMLQSNGSVVVHLGAENWPFPIPIVKEGSKWHFDTTVGHQEVLNRRIGANELNAIKVCQAYVDAQREYYSEPRGEEGVIEYAGKIVSDTGKRNGLYWRVAAGEPVSPMGPLIATAEAEGYQPGKKTGHGYHGYRFHILSAQGPNAPGGAYSYVINGHMVAGFAMIAYPLEYGKTGEMTYIVNQNGVVYQKDLGDKTEDLAKAIQAYDPDSSWKKY
ncbi:unnamed protein product [Phaeothamnion confervicola]